MQDIDRAQNLSTLYTPVAVYYEQADSLELRDFANFYLQPGMSTKLGDDFESLVGLLELAFSQAGGEVVDEMRKSAYAQARMIALEDSVEVHDLPRAAGAR